MRNDRNRMNPPPIPPLLSQSQGSIICFSLDRWDVFRCRLWIMAYNRFLIILSLGLSLGIPLLNLRDPEIASRSVGFRLFYIVVFTTGLTFGIMVALQVLVQLVWLMLQKNRGVLGAHELEIHDQGLTERTDVNESMHRWSGFHKVSSTRRYLFVYVTENIMHYIPKRCFPSSGEAKKFKDEIERRWKDASKHQ
jgi:hypothetical protein